MYNSKIDKCPHCGVDLSDEEVVFEETPSQIPHIMWQTCKEHGKVSEFIWHPAWRLLPSTKVKLFSKKPKPLPWYEAWIKFRNSFKN